MGGTLLGLLCVGISLIQLDVTVVNVALPAVRVDLGTGLSGQQWFVAAYMVALAGLLLVFGMLGDRVGHRRVGHSPSFVSGLPGHHVADRGVIQSAGQMVRKMVERSR